MKFNNNINIIKQQQQQQQQWQKKSGSGSWLMMAECNFQITKIHYTVAISHVTELFQIVAVALFYYFLSLSLSLSHIAFRVCSLLRCPLASKPKQWQQQRLWYTVERNASNKTHTQIAYEYYVCTHYFGLMINLH